MDQALSPYSDEYFEQQMALYREISGRELNQELGELHSENVAPLRHAPNPTGITSAAQVASYVRSVASMLALSGLGDMQVVLDMGAGHGLGSEVLAYAGCEVHAVDIDAGLGALSRERAAVRGLNLTRFDMNFDDISALDDHKYDGAFFFQSLHHSLRPWKLIADLTEKLRADAIIAFAGEPIQDIWWRHWGLRLDPVSLYVARARGWFESGWSYAFIRDCFERSGFQLTFFSGGDGAEIGIATRSETMRRDIVNRADRLGLSEVHAIGSVGSDHQYRTVRGDATQLCGRPAYRQNLTGQGALVYGPYSDAKAGRYEFSIIVCCEPRVSWFVSWINIDVIHRTSAKPVFKTRVLANLSGKPSLKTYRFDLVEDVCGLEVRVFPHGSARWTTTLPSLCRLDV